MKKQLGVTFATLNVILGLILLYKAVIPFAFFADADAYASCDLIFMLFMTAPCVISAAGTLLLSRFRFRMISRATGTALAVFAFAAALSLIEAIYFIAGVAASFIGGAAFLLLCRDAVRYFKKDKRR